MLPITFLLPFFDKLISERAKKISERLILRVAIASYILHLILIALANFGLIPMESKFLSNPISAIYTPFSFILLYEVYLLIFYLPKSISYYIGKQYEIITLIVIRRIFKDIGQLKLSSNWFQINSDLQFTYDVLTSLVLFILIHWFYKNTQNVISQGQSSPVEKEDRIHQFIRLKKSISVVLVPLLLFLASNSLISWVFASISDYLNGINAFKNINNIFFDEFFTVLIVVYVLLLLASFFYTDQFYKIFRNSGFVISTILIKISFSVDGLVNNALIIGAVLFGLSVLYIHNLYEKNSAAK